MDTNFNTSAKIHQNVETLLPMVEQWKNEGNEVVFTNGCFDIVHLGHIDYLEKSRNLGDKLIVAINTDASVQRNKGLSRPIIDQMSRSHLMAALAFVDAVVMFDEETPLNLISKLIPDILVKGKDYTIDKIVGAEIVIDNGGKVETIELVQGYSTSNFVNKIKNE